MSRAPYFPERPVKLDYIYFHVGRVTVNWANAEEGIAACIRIFARAVPDPLFQRPISTKRRITEFKRLIRLINITEDQRATGTELIERFSYLAWHRHWTTHGQIPTKSFIGETWRRQRGLVEFHRWNLSTDELEALEIHLSDLDDMGDEALSLYSDIWSWITVDLGCSTPKKTEKFIRKVGVRPA